MKKIVFLSVFFVFSYMSFCQTSITSNDYIFTKANDGYELFIRKPDDINSILLTESQQDPEKLKTNYGLRTKKFYECNGNETRILDGKVLQTKYDSYFLVDSTPEMHPKLGMSFHFFLPEEVVYGYSWGREGSMKIYPGLKINCRLFKKHFADYSGGFADKWVTLRLTNSNNFYHNNLLPSMEEFCDLVDGDLIVQDRDVRFKDFLLKVLPDKIPSGDITEVVFIFDTTLSMQDEMPAFKTAMETIKKGLSERVKILKIGFILYKDYSDVYLNKVYPLSEKEDDYKVAIKDLRASGGDDIPEAVYEAIVQLNNFDFVSENRVAFLIGDAPPHKVSKVGVSIHDAANAISKNNIKFNAICVPYK